MEERLLPHLSPERSTDRVPPLVAGIRVNPWARSESLQPPTWLRVHQVKQQACNIAQRFRPPPTPTTHPRKARSYAVIKDTGDTAAGRYRQQCKLLLSLLWHLRPRPKGSLPRAELHSHREGRQPQGLAQQVGKCDLGDGKGPGEKPSAPSVSPAFAADKVPAVGKVRAQMTELEETEGRVLPGKDPSPRPAVPRVSRVSRLPARRLTGNPGTVPSP